MGNSDQKRVLRVLYDRNGGNIKKIIAAEYVEKHYRNGDVRVRYKKPHRIRRWVAIGLIIAGGVAWASHEVNSSKPTEGPSINLVDEQMNEAKKLIGYIKDMSPHSLHVMANSLYRNGWERNQSVDDEKCVVNFFGELLKDGLTVSGDDTQIEWNKQYHQNLYIAMMDDMLKDKIGQAVSKGDYSNPDQVSIFHDRRFGTKIDYQGQRLGAKTIVNTSHGDTLPNTISKFINVLYDEKNKPNTPGEYMDFLYDCVALSIDTVKYDRSINGFTSELDMLYVRENVGGMQPADNVKKDFVENKHNNWLYNNSRSSK